MVHIMLFGEYVLFNIHEIEYCVLQIAYFLSCTYSECVVVYVLVLLSLLVCV